MGTDQRSFESPSPNGLPFLEIGGLQLSYPLLSQEQVKLRTSNLGDIFTWMNEWMNTYIYIAPVKQKSSEALAAE